MNVSLEREEVLSCVIALERWKKPGAWGKSALAKLEKALAKGKHNGKQTEDIGQGQ